VAGIAEKRKMELPEIKMIKVCETQGEDCECEGFVQQVGSQTHLFCCQDGFVKSLEAYQKFLAQEDLRNN